MHRYNNNSNPVYSLSPVCSYSIALKTTYDAKLALIAEDTNFYFSHWTSTIKPNAPESAKNNKFVFGASHVLKRQSAADYIRSAECLAAHLHRLGLQKLF